MENHLLGHLSIFDSWLKLRRHVAVSFAFSGHKTEVNVGIFTHLRLSWLESPENNIKGIKSLRQIENKAWSVTVCKFLQPLSRLKRPGFLCFFFFLFQSIHLSVLWYTPGRWDIVLHAIIEILRNILPHPQQWQKIKNTEVRQYNVYNNFENSNASLRFTFFHCS